MQYAYELNVIGTTQLNTIPIPIHIGRILVYSYMYSTYNVHYKFIQYLAWLFLRLKLLTNFK